MRIIPFLFENEHTVRTGIGENGEILFAGLDICRILGIKKHDQALAKLGADEKAPLTIGGERGERTLTGVTEPGFYRLIFVSRKPEAERVKHWLAHDVLPSLRKTGTYSKPKEAIANPLPTEFPGWSMDEMRTKKGIVEMYRLTYGPMAAQWILPQVGFPVPPRETMQFGRQFELWAAVIDGPAQ